MAASSRLAADGPRQGQVGVDRGQGRSGQFDHHIPVVEPDDGDLIRHPDAGDLAVLGALFLGQDRWDEAEEALLRSLAIWEYPFGPHHYEVAVVQHSLAALYTARGDRQQAKHAYQRVLSIKRDVLGPNHPEVTGLQQHVDQLGS
jgi:tetratricopeptide (TPR) repeat protein